MADISAQLAHYQKLLITQYRIKPKAQQTIGLMVNQAICDGLPFQLARAFDLNLAGYTFPSYDIFTALMLHLDNNFVDSSKNLLGVSGTNVTFSNAAGNYKWGFSAYLNGSAYITVPASAALNFAGNDFTIECQIKPTTITGLQGLYFAGPNSTVNMFFRMNAGALEFYAYNNSGTLVAQYATGAVLTAGVLQHIELVRNGTQILIFVNGVSQSLTVNVPIGSTVLPNYNTSTASFIGEIGGGSFYTGYIDEFRISNGVARNIVSFDPPALPYGVTAIPPKFAQAVGAQLDILGRIVGVPRYVYGLDLAHTFFSFVRYNDTTARPGFGRYNDNPYTSSIWLRYIQNSTLQMTDFEMVSCIMLKIIQNNTYTTYADVNNALWTVFGSHITLVDNANMSITYHADGVYFPILQIASFLGILPKPMGVSLTIVTP